MNQEQERDQREGDDQQREKANKKKIGVNPSFAVEWMTAPRFLFTWRKRHLLSHLTFFFTLSINGMKAKLKFANLLNFYRTKARVFL